MVKVYADNGVQLPVRAPNVARTVTVETQTTITVSVSELKTILLDYFRATDVVEPDVRDQDVFLRTEYGDSVTDGLELKWTKKETR